MTLPMEPLAGETRITVLADSKASGCCLHFTPGAVPDLEISDLLMLRGERGQRVVKGCRRSGAPMEEIVLISPHLCEQIAGSVVTDELEAFLSSASRWEAITDLGRGALFALIAAVVGFFAAVAATIATFIATESALALALLVLALGCIGAAFRAVGAARSAIEITCP
jgi:hypothetical protein